MTATDDHDQGSYVKLDGHTYPPLRAIHSTGPLYGAPAGNSRCGGCQKTIAVGESITNYRGTWWHQACSLSDIQAGSPREAWLALGHDLARYPRAYKVTESRAIIGALLGMIHEES